jgi:hypothetical protein
MTKAELAAEVEELRRKVELLEARLLIAEQQRTTVVLPSPVYPQPHWWGPYWGQPQVWCSTTTNTLGDIYTAIKSADPDATVITAGLSAAN